MVGTGYCAIERDFQEDKAFIKSLGNSVQREASRFDITSIPYDKDEKAELYQKLQEKSLDLASLARQGIEQKDIENKVILKGSQGHLEEKSKAMNDSQKELEASKQMENQLEQIFDKKGAYCHDGACSERKEESTRDFEDDASKLLSISSEAEAVKNTKDKTVQTQVFGGYAHQCKIRPIRFLDCCSDKGWGKDLHLANCTTEDLQLGHAKLQFRAHYVGEYCSKRVKWPGGSKCTESKRTYCVFYTKISRIIREQGPYTQSVFIKNFGSPEYPDCSGFMPNELGFLNLGVVNFKDPIYPFNPYNPFGHAANTDAGISVDINQRQISKEDVTNKAYEASGKDAA